MKRLVAIELKLDKFKPEHKGKVELPKIKKINRVINTVVHSRTIKFGFSVGNFYFVTIQQ